MSTTTNDIIMEHSSAIGAGIGEPGNELDSYEPHVLDIIMEDSSTLITPQDKPLNDDDGDDPTVFAKRRVAEDEFVPSVEPGANHLTELCVNPSLFMELFRLIHRNSSKRDPTFYPRMSDLREKPQDPSTPVKSTTERTVPGAPSRPAASTRNVHVRPMAPLVDGEEEEEEEQQQQQEVQQQQEEMRGDAAGQVQQQEPIDVDDLDENDGDVADPPTFSNDLTSRQLFLHEKDVKYDYFHPPAEASESNDWPIFNNYDILNLVLCCRSHLELKQFLRPVDPTLLLRANEIKSDAVLDLPRKWSNKLQMPVDLRSAYPLVGDTGMHFHLFGRDAFTMALRNDARVMDIRQLQHRWSVSSLEGHLSASPTFRWFQREGIFPSDEISVEQCAKYIHYTLLADPVGSTYTLFHFDAAEMGFYMLLTVWILAPWFWALEAPAHSVYVLQPSWSFSFSLLHMEICRGDTGTSIRYRSMPDCVAKFILHCLPMAKGTGLISFMANEAYKHSWQINRDEACPEATPENACQLVGLANFFGLVGGKALRDFASCAAWHRKELRQVVKYSLRTGDLELARAIIPHCAVILTEGEILQIPGDYPITDANRTQRAALHLFAYALSLARDGADGSHGILKDGLDHGEMRYPPIAFNETRHEMEVQLSKQWVGNVCRVWKAMYGNCGIDFASQVIKAVADSDSSFLLHGLNIFHGDFYMMRVLESIACFISLLGDQSQQRRRGLVALIGRISHVLDEVESKCTRVAFGMYHGSWQQEWVMNSILPRFRKHLFDCLHVARSSKSRAKV